MPAMKLSPPECICFDLDGTLVDSVADLTVACNLMLQEMGALPLDEETVRGYIGDGARKLVERSLANGGLQVDHALRRFRFHYGVHLLDHTQCYQGVRETLEKLHRDGITMGVVTNKPHEFALRIVDGLDLGRYFISVAGARTGVPVKPAPDLLRLALDEMRQLPARSWMVGDSVNDVKAAHAAGCTPIALSYGIGKLEALQAAEPAVILDAFSEIFELME